jgi:hypothetical protein
MQHHHALPPKQPARQEPVDAAHADRHHRPPANPSGLAGSNCGEIDVPSTAGGDAADQASRGFEGWPRGASSRCMHFTYKLHAGHGARVRPWKPLQLAREPQGRGFADNQRPSAPFQQGRLEAGARQDHSALLFEFCTDQTENRTLLVGPTTSLGSRASYLAV